MVSLNSIILTTVAVFGVFNNYTYVLVHGGVIYTGWKHSSNPSSFVEQDVLLLTDLDTFLSSYTSTEKIVKLNFKTTDAFISAVPIMKNSFRNFQPITQVWLHADILLGSGLEKKKDNINLPSLVDAKIFIETVANDFPRRMLSLGWYTVYETSDKYTQENIKDMLDILRSYNYEKPVNYMVRASLIDSEKEFITLLRGSPKGSTLTIWSDRAQDPLNYTAIAELLKAVSANFSVYIDLSYMIFRQITEALDTAVSEDQLYRGCMTPIE